MIASEHFLNSDQVLMLKLKIHVTRKWQKLTHPVIHVL